MYRGPYGHIGFGLGLGLLFLLLMAAAVAAVVIGVLTLTRRPGQPRTAGGNWPPPGLPSPQPGTAAAQVAPSAAAFGAEQVLADRLARGEIDVADYEERIAALRRHAADGYPAPPPEAQPPVTPPPST